MKQTETGKLFVFVTPITVSNRESLCFINLFQLNTSNLQAHAEITSTNNYYPETN